MNPEQVDRAEAGGHAPQRLHALMMELVRWIGLLQVDQDAGRSLSITQAFTLHELDRPDPPSQRELAQRLRLEKSTVSRLAADLERKGLLVRERDPANRRFYQLRLTEQGRAMHAQLSAGFDRQYARWVALMTEQERDALLVGLAALVRAMREHPAEHPAG